MSYEIIYMVVPIKCFSFTECQSGYERTGDNCTTLQCPPGTGLNFAAHRCDTCREHSQPKDYGTYHSCGKPS